MVGSSPFIFFKNSKSFIEVGYRVIISLGNRALDIAVSDVFAIQYVIPAASRIVAMSFCEPRSW